MVGLIIKSFATSGGLFVSGGTMEKRGFYIVKDSFFSDMNEFFLKGNKLGNRPHYYCFQDSNRDIYWMIPLSSQIQKYREIIKKKELKYKRCDTLYIAKLDDGKESVFLIQDMFPITIDYIEREYTIGGNHFLVTSNHTAKIIEQKARTVLALLKRGIKFMPTQPNVIRLYKILKDRINNND